VLAPRHQRTHSRCELRFSGLEFGPRRHASKRY
jgi:hypothetical protein